MSKKNRYFILLELLICMMLCLVYSQAESTSILSPTDLIESTVQSGKDNSLLLLGTPTDLDPSASTPTDLDPQESTPTDLGPQESTPTDLDPHESTPTDLNPDPATPTDLDPSIDLSSIRIGGSFPFTEGISLSETAVYYVNSGLPLSRTATIGGNGEYEDLPYSCSVLCTYGITNFDQIRKGLDENPVFEAKLLQGNVSWIMEEASDHSSFDICLTSMPAAGEASFQVSCSIAGMKYTNIVNFRFVELRTLPSGTATDCEEPYIVHVGEALDKPAPIQFANNWSVGNYQDGWWAESIDSGNAIDRDGSCWKTAGVYRVGLVAASENVRIQKNISVMIVGSDGTIPRKDYVPLGTVTELPNDLQKIEKEALSATNLTEIDIPAGVSIAEDAFSGTGLIAIFAHDQATVDYAVSHGFIAVID